MDIENNTVFLRKIEPTKLIVVAFFIWFFLWIISPLKVNININYEAFVFIFCSFVAFLVGFFLLKKKEYKVLLPKKFNISDSTYQHKKYVFNIIILIAILGLSLKLVDRFFIRGISFGTDFIENRDLMVEGGGNFVGILSTFLTPFCYFPLFFLLKYKFKVCFIKKLLIYALYIGQVFDAILLSSRSSIFLNVTFLILYLLYFKKININVRTVLITFSFIILFIILMNYVFIQRTGTFSDDVYTSVLYYANINFSVTATPEFLYYFEKSHNSVKAILLSYVITLQYFVHGLFEFSYVYDHFDTSKHSMGSYTFVTYYRFLCILLGVPFDSNDILELSPRVGVYTTLLGPLYIDFGWYNLIWMFFLGYFVRKIYYLALKGVDWAVIMYFFFFIVLIFWPIFNFISGAGGIFILTSIILLSFLNVKIKV